MAKLENSPVSSRFLVQLPEFWHVLGKSTDFLESAAAGDVIMFNTAVGASQDWQQAVHRFSFDREDLPANRRSYNVAISDSQQNMTKNDGKTVEKLLNLNEFDDLAVWQCLSSSICFLNSHGYAHFWTCTCQLVRAF